MNLLTSFHVGSPASVSGRDAAVLEALNRSEDAIGVAEISALIEHDTLRQPRLVTIYSTINDLERRGLIRVNRTDRGSRRPRKLYETTALGRSALDLMAQMAKHVAALEVSGA